MFFFIDLLKNIILYIYNYYIYL